MDFGDLYLVRSRTILGSIIRFITRSRFSHGGIVLYNGKGLEATWKGVRIVNLSQYERLTVLTPLRPLTDAERVKLHTFVKEQNNVRYDYWALIGFLLARRLQNPKKLYCFELQWSAYVRIGRSLGRLDRNFIDGTLIYFSNDLKVIQEE